jgi:hypothetical protein
MHKERDAWTDDVCSDYEIGVDLVVQERGQWRDAICIECSGPVEKATAHIGMARRQVCAVGWSLYRPQYLNSLHGRLTLSLQRERTASLMSDIRNVPGLEPSEGRSNNCKEATTLPRKPTPAPSSSILLRRTRTNDHGRKSTMPPNFRRDICTWIENQVLGEDKTGKPCPQAGCAALYHRP